MQSIVQSKPVAFLDFFSDAMLQNRHRVKFLWSSICGGTKFCTGWQAAQVDTSLVRANMWVVCASNISAPLFGLVLMPVYRDPPGIRHHRVDVWHLTTWRGSISTEPTPVWTMISQSSSLFFTRPSWVASRGTRSLASDLNGLAN